VTEWIAGSITLFVAGMVQGCTGFGLALVAAPCLMLAMPPTMVVPLLVLMSTVNSMVVAFDARRHIRPRLVIPLALGGVMGLPLGILALRAIDAQALKMGVGLFVAAFAGALLAGWRKPVRNRPLTLVPVGMASGFLGGSTSMGGPPAILFLANQGTPKDVFRGSIVCYFFTVNCFAIAMFASRGMITTHTLGNAALIAPGMLLGTFVGVRLSRRVSEAGFRRIVMIGLLIMGIVLFATSLASATT